MKRIRLLGLTLIAVFALGALASASAFAEEPTLTNEAGVVPTAGSPQPFAAESPTATELITSAGGKVGCTSALGKGSFTSQDSGEVEIEFKGCTDEGAKCNSDGTAGVINVKGPTQLVDVLPTGTLDLGVWIEPKSKAGGTLKFTCGTIKTEVLGSVIGVVDNKTGTLLTPAEGAEAKTEVKALWKANASKDQEITTCMSLKALCEKGPFELKSNLGLGKGEELSAQIGDALIKFTNKVKIAF